MAGLSDLIVELTQLEGQIHEYAKKNELAFSKTDESIGYCKNNLTLLPSQLETMTHELDIRDKKIMLLQCQMDEVTKARDRLANLKGCEAELDRMQRNEMEHILKMNLELENENKTLISRIIKKEALLEHLENCELTIESEVKIKNELLRLENHNKDIETDLKTMTAKYQRIHAECQSYSKIINDLKLNLKDLEGLSEIIKKLEAENNTYLVEINKKTLENQKLQAQSEEKDKRLEGVYRQLDKSSKRCERLEEELLSNIVNVKRTLEEENKRQVHEVEERKKTLGVSRGSATCQSDTGSSQIITLSESYENWSFRQLCKEIEVEYLKIYSSNLCKSNEKLNEQTEVSLSQCKRSSPSNDADSEYHPRDTFTRNDDSDSGAMTLENAKSTRTIGMMTDDCDQKVGRHVSVEDLIRGLLPCPPLSREKSKIDKFSKKVKSIDDLKRMQGKCGQRDVLIEIKKFYEMKMSDMQKNFKEEAERRQASYEATLFKINMQHKEKINLLMRKHDERVNKIILAHEEELKRISVQHKLVQQLTEKMNRSNKVNEKKMRVDPQ